MGNPIVPENLTLSDLKRLKSRSFRVIQTLKPCIPYMSLLRPYAAMSPLKINGQPYMGSLNVLSEI